MSTDRPSIIVAAFASTFGEASVRQSDPRQVFEQLAQHVEGLEPAELASAAAAAKRLGSELNALAYRLAQAEAGRLRRAAGR